MNKNIIYFLNINFIILFYMFYIITGLYGNDDFHNGLLQAFSSGKQVEGLVLSLKRQVCVKVLEEKIINKYKINIIVLLFF